MNISFKNFNWKFGHKKPSFGKNVTGDWKTILVSIVILSVLVIILSVYMFIKIDKREVFVIKKPVDDVEKTIDLKLLKETVSYYGEKVRTFEMIIKNGVQTSDPSL